MTQLILDNWSGAYVKSFKISNTLYFYFFEYTHITEKDLMVPVRDITSDIVVAWGKNIAVFDLQTLGLELQLIFYAHLSFLW